MLRATTSESEQKFQFTPLREGRRVCYGRIYYEIVFQFTPLREGRLGEAQTVIEAQAISIHAPPRGATAAGTGKGNTTLFQFTPLREGRRFSASRPMRGTYFNSRPSARGDHVLRSLYVVVPISIHAPPRGATRMRCASCKRTSFQFTPLREGRRMNAKLRSGCGCHFNSRPSARGDPTLRRRRTLLMYFNSRPSARGD